MPTSGTRQMTLSEYLLAEGLLTVEQIQILWGMVDKTGVGFGAAAVRAGFLDEAQVAQAMAEVCHVPYLDLAEYLIDPVIARLIPQHIARRHRLISINRVVNRLTVAMADPVNIIAIDDIQLMTGLQVKVVVAPDSEIMAAIEKAYVEPDPDLFL